jgi:hypothetical protein
MLYESQSNMNQNILQMEALNKIIRKQNSFVKKGLGVADKV